MKRSWVITTVGFFFLVSIAGVLLRMVLLQPISGLDYHNVLHAHSHLAFLGWVYLALYILFIRFFFTDHVSNSIKKQININIGLTQLVILAMFISFIFLGYKSLSIVFLASHVFLSYWFLGIVYYQLNQNKKRTGRQSISAYFAKGSLFYLFLSTLATYGIAIAASHGLKDKPIYDMVVYLFLHFQYNGWFILGIFAIFYAILEKKNISFSPSLAMLHFRLYAWLVIPAYLLNILWADLHWVFYVIAILAAITQFISLLVFLKIVLSVKEVLLKYLKGLAKVFLILSFAALLLRGTMELFSILPSMGDLIYDTRSIIIGYLHLTLLGVVSFFLVGVFMDQGWIAQTKVSYTGAVLLILGFVINELVLFLQGLWSWIGFSPLKHANYTLLLASILMMLGIALFIINIKNKGVVKNGTNV